jgi:hypothetical protein
MLCEYEKYWMSLSTPQTRLKIPRSHYQKKLAFFIDFSSVLAKFSWYCKKSEKDFTFCLQSWIGIFLQLLYFVESPVNEF